MDKKPEVDPGKAIGVIFLMIAVGVITFAVVYLAIHVLAMATVSMFAP